MGNNVKGIARDHKAWLRKMAESRNETWAARSLEEQLGLLPADGATKQRARILKKIAAQKTPGHAG